MILADLGARVIKVEVPPRGDDAREIGPFMNGRSAYFMSLNRGKESLAIDLKTAASANCSMSCSSTPMSWSRTSVPESWRNWATAGTTCTPAILV